MSIELRAKLPKIAANAFEIFSTSEHWELFPDTAEALVALKRQGLTLGVVSNNDERVCEPLPFFILSLFEFGLTFFLSFLKAKILRSLGIQEHFSFVITSRGFGRAKPSPEIFQEALLEAGVTDPQQAMHVGDDMERDIRGARKAGMRGLLLDRSGREFRDEKGIKSLNELMAHVVV